MDEVAVKIDHISKTFKLPHEKQSSIKGALINVFRGGKRSFEQQQVLKDVSIEIKKGEFFGIVGRNGSGKSTLLKLIAGIYAPTKGSIQVNGMLTPFIELGVGFNQELTGRENVFLNGALLGFSRKEMEVMYEGIVEFAELHKFMDQKLKNYSSGMQVRLAFSIAIRAKSEILVLDEVLAVGDEAFQQKCVDVFEDYKSRGQTIILVTHDMQTVRKFCNRAVLIQNGSVTVEGEPNKVATAYSKLNSESILNELDEVNAQPQESPINLEILDMKNKPTASFDVNGQIKIKMSWPRSLEGVKNVGLAIIKNSGEFMFGSNTLKTNPDLTSCAIDFTMDLNLGPGKYYLMAGLFGETEHDIVSFLEHGPQIILMDDPNTKLHGMVRLKHNWIEERHE